MLPVVIFPTDVRINLVMKIDNNITPIDICKEYYLALFWYFIGLITIFNFIVE